MQVAVVRPASCSRQICKLQSSDLQVATHRAGGLHKPRGGLQPKRASHLHASGPVRRPNWKGPKSTRIALQPNKDKTRTVRSLKSPTSSGHGPDACKKIFEKGANVATKWSHETKAYRIDMTPS